MFNLKKNMAKDLNNHILGGIQDVEDFREGIFH